MSPGSPLNVMIVAEAAAGGVATHLADLVRGLAALGEHVHLAVPAGDRLDPAVIDASVRHCCASVTCLPMPRRIGWRDVPAWWNLSRLLARVRPDIVHSHSSKAGVLARACRGPWRQVYTPHALYTLNPSLSRLQRRVFGGVEALLGRHRTDRLIAVSQTEARHAQESLGIPSSRIVTIPNGVQPVCLLGRDAARAALGLHPTRFMVGFVGRFAHQKGLDRLVRVAELLQADVGGALEFALIGTGDLQAAAGRPVERLPANVRVIGRVDHARKYLSAFDVLLVPSRYEGFPYVYLEAMAAGLPIVTARVAGASELVDAEQIGLVVVNQDDPQAMAGAVRTLYANAALRGRLASRCAAALGRYTAQAMVARTAAVYRQLVEERT
ncbi:Glycosyltransferase family 1 protein [Cupriavidus sp. H18C2]